MFSFYEEVEMGCQVWDRGFQRQFCDFESARSQSEDLSLHFHAASWTNLAEHAALAGHMLYLEDGPEILDPEQKEELENMYAPACASLEQVRLTAEHVVELQRRVQAPS
jgi:hypothetical protein